MSGFLYQSGQEMLEERWKEWLGTPDGERFLAEEAALAAKVNEVHPWPVSRPPTRFAAVAGLLDRFVATSVAGVLGWALLGFCAGCALGKRR